MIERFRVLLKRPFIRYLIIGGSVYVFELVVIVVVQRLGGNALLAVGTSFWLGLVVSFILQKLVTFGDRRLHHAVLLPQLGAVCALVLFNFGFTLFITKLFSAWLPAAATRTIALGLTTCWNFYLYKRKIFRQPSDPSMLVD